MKTTLTMPLRRISQRLHLDEALPTDPNQPTFQQPPTQTLSTITKETEHPTFDSIQEIQLQ
jgi:hypothetical protein